jgi:acetyltransferase-like isoleucine patch superfamily enzyme
MFFSEIILFFIFSFVFIKPVIFLISLFFSFIYFNYIDRKKQNVSWGGNDVASIANTVIGRVKKEIKHYANGILFFSVLQTGKIPFHHIRNFLYKKIFRANIKEKVVIYSGAEIRSPNKLSIGKGTIIGHNCILDARNIIDIGDNVNLSTGVWLWTEQHDYNNPDFGYDFKKKKKITIGDRVWIGSRVIVLPGCIIGEGAVIGSGTVVTKDIEPFSLNAGVPSKKIKERNKNLVYVFNGEHLPFV